MRSWLRSPCQLRAMAPGANATSAAHAAASRSGMRMVLWFMLGVTRARGARHADQPEPESSEPPPCERSDSASSEPDPLDPEPCDEPPSSPPEPERPRCELSL